MFEKILTDFVVHIAQNERVKLCNTYKKHIKMNGWQKNNRQKP
jgi:hypothetical protein